MLIILTIILSLNMAFADEKKEGQVIYEFKKYEQIDLGSLEIKGNILAPGDITVTETSHSFDDRTVYERKNFSDLYDMDIKDLR